MRDLDVVMKFGKGVPDELQGEAMLQLERWMRTRSGKDIWVLKETKADDSKLRLLMTDEERSKL